MPRSPWRSTIPCSSRRRRARPRSHQRPSRDARDEPSTPPPRARSRPPRTAPSRARPAHRAGSDHARATSRTAACPADAGSPRLRRRDELARVPEGDARRCASRRTRQRAARPHAGGGRRSRYARVASAAPLGRRARRTPATRSRNSAGRPRRRRRSPRPRPAPSPRYTTIASASSLRSSPSAARWRVPSARSISRGCVSGRMQPRRRSYRRGRSPRRRAAANAA